MDLSYTRSLNRTPDLATRPRSSMGRRESVHKEQGSMEGLMIENEYLKRKLETKEVIVIQIETARLKEEVILLKGLLLERNKELENAKKLVMEEKVKHDPQKENTLKANTYWVKENHKLRMVNDDLKEEIERLKAEAITRGPKSRLKTKESSQTSCEESLRSRIKVLETQMSKNRPFNK